MSRRVSINDHQAWHHSLLGPNDIDDILDDDGLVADPLIERHANRRKESQANQVLRILDELERSGDT